MSMTVGSKHSVGVERGAVGSGALALLNGDFSFNSFPLMYFRMFGESANIAGPEGGTAGLSETSARFNDSACGHLHVSGFYHVTGCIDQY